MRVEDVRAIVIDRMEITRKDGSKILGDWILTAISCERDGNGHPMWMRLGTYQSETRAQNALRHLLYTLAQF